MELLFLAVVTLFQFSVTVSGLNVFNYTICKSQNFGEDSFVCTCTEEYCDGFSDKRVPLASDGFAVYTSSKNAARLSLKIGSISKYPKINEYSVILKVNTTKKFQKVLGFGGAFTGNLN